jgi:large repetitive protein
MKLKNYLLIVILLITSVFSLSAQVNSKNNTEQVEPDPINVQRNRFAEIPFAARIPGTPGNVRVRGDVVFVGNHIIQATNDGGSNSNTSATFPNIVPTYTPYNSANIDNLAALTIKANINNNSVSVNNGKNFEYIDVDTDPTTFSSSTADLRLRNIDGTVNSCKRIVYAGLYWSALYSFDRTSQSSPAAGGNPAFTHPAIPINPDWNKIKFKVPGGSYLDLTADTAADTAGDEDEIIVNAVGNGLIGSPYTCYKNVTSLVAGLTDANGTYAVANMRATRGRQDTYSGSGWTLVIIYESPSFPSKYITIFDGYQLVSPTTPQDPTYYDVSGFQTVPTGPVRAKFGFAGLEGDQAYTGDAISIKSPISGTPASGTYNPINNSLNPADNTFNCSISTMSTTPTPLPILVNTRVPNGLNTMGFDLDLMEIPNTLNVAIANNATNATIKLDTTGDQYSVFMNAFSIDIIEPKIIITKVVKNNAGVLIGSTQVALGQVLNYEITYQNIGNDSATNFTIKDILPLNVLFNPADLVLPAGVTFTYNAVTREIIFTIPNNQVLANSITFNTIKIKVTVDPNPLAFINACSNTIENKAFAFYTGAISGIVVNEQLSFAYFNSTGCYADPASATNFIVNVGTSNFIKNEVLCGSSVVLTAPSGYVSYSWTNTATGATVIGSAQTQTVTAVGTYVVYCDIGSPCTPAFVTFNVTAFGTGITNPIIPYSDVNPLPICASNNDPMPIIKLCGNQCKQINLNIAAAISITWQQLVEPSCPTNLFPNCAILDPALPALPCAWTNVSTTSSYNVCNAGQYRLIIVYQGGCQRIFYFNVYKSNLTPTYTVANIGCSGCGNITVNGLPPGYQYQLENISGTILVPYQNSNVFPICTAGDFIVKVRINGATVFDCIYSITASVLNFGVTFSMTATPIQPLCFIDKGKINIQINGASPQYTYNVLYSTTSTGATIPYVNSGPINANTYQLTGLDPGFYTITGSSQNGCTNTKVVEIIRPPLLELTAGLTTAVTCNAGLIDFYPLGGFGTYTYQVTTNGVVGAFTTDDFINVPVPNPNTGAPVTTTYGIKVVDYNNCETTTSITVTSHPEPVFNITTTGILCFGNCNGTLTFNVTSNLGNYILAYSIDNGLTYQNSPNFVNLCGGVKECIVKYTLPGEPSCFMPVQSKIVVQPITGLTASGGVSQLACLNTGTGIIRVTNPQGGSPFLSPLPPYLYSFDGGITYGAVNESPKAPGTHTVYIKDSSGCTFPMIITLDPIITPPTIALGPPVFNCNGTSTNTVTVNNNGGNFLYEYILDPPNPINTATPSNVFNNVSCGPHTVRVNYKATNISTFSNLLNETFGSGLNTTTPGIAAAYCWNYQPIAPIPSIICPRPGNPTYSTYALEDNQYDVTRAIIPNNGAWFPYRDHTSAVTGPIDPAGRFLAVNIGDAAGANGILYSQTINNILPNQPVKVELYVANLLLTGVVADDPSFILELTDLAGNTIGGLAGQVSTGIIDNDPTVPADPSYVANGWRLKKLSLNPGNNTTLKFNIRSGSILYQGNDVAIDDIRVFQEPIACTSFIDFPINIPCGNVFDSQITSYGNVKCAGDTNGTVTIAAQYFNTTTGFYYQLNNAGPWINSLTSPVVINNLPVGTTIIKVRYDSLLTTCEKTLTQVIAAPPLLVATATPTQATCNVPAIITASATGGTATYQYQLETLSGTIVTPYQSSNIFNPVAVGSYVVRIKDFNNCIKVSPTVIINVIPLPTAIIATSSDLCYDGTNGATIVVTASGGLAPYQYGISPSFVYANPNSFPVLPGSHIIKVRDANGCIFTLPTQIIAPQLLINAVLTKDIDCSSTPNALVTGTVSGGTTPYTYQINTGTVYGAALPFSPVGGNVMTYSSATAGTVKIKVTDATGCSSESTLINITTPTTITGQAVATQATCGLSNATVTLSALTGTPGYTYSFNGSTYSSTTVYTNVAPGTYPYKIIDSKFCEFVSTVTVTSPSAITGSAVISTPYTCSGLGCITISASNGTSPYTYSLGGTFVSNPQFCNLTNGTYTPVIKDASGCTLTLTTITIAPLNPPTNITFSNTAPNCPSQTANVTVNAVATNPIVTYQITAPATAVTSQASNVFNNLAVGTYTFKVTDDKLCTYTETYTIVPVTPISVVGQLVNNVQCYGSSTGNIKYTVSGFSSNFNYQIGANPLVTNYSSSVINFTNQPAGSYTITVTDNITNCTGTATVEIAQPAVALSITKVVTAKTCAAAGSVAITAIGGWGSNSFELTTPAPVTTTTNTTGTFPNLTIVGLYSIKVTDGNGCVVTDTFNLVAPVAPIVTIDPISDLCFDGVNGASITVNVSGGLAPYQYFIGTASNPSNVFSNINPGSYVISVTDANGCSTSLPAIVIAPQLTVNAVLTKQLDCSASPNAIYTFTVAGGYPGYSYQVNFNGGGFLPLLPSAFAGNVFTYTLASGSLNGAGNYIIKITDSKGCTVSRTIDLLPLVPVAATNVVTNVKCNGSNTGVVSITPSGGSGTGYLVNFNGAGFNPTLTYSGLVAGTYNYIVKDSKDCIFNGSAVVTNLYAPLAFSAPIVTPLTIPTGGCADLAIDNGAICIPSITGGLAPYNITMTSTTSPDTFPTFLTPPTGFPICYNNLGFGYYIITITDANNCSISTPIIQIALPPTGLNITPNIFPSTCANGGSIQLTLSGPFLANSATYYYALLTPNSPTTPAPNNYQTYLTNPGIYALGNVVGSGTTSHVFSGLTPNTQYTFVIYSFDNKCYYLQTATTAEVAASATTLTITSLIPSNVSCAGAGNADASITYTYATYGTATSVTSSVYTTLNVLVPGTTSTQTGLTGAPVTVFNVGPLPTGSYTVRFTVNNGPDTGCTNGSAQFTITQSATPLTITTSVIKNDACGKNIGQVLGTTNNGGAQGYLYQIFSAAAAAALPINIPINNPAYLAFLATFSPTMTSSSFGGLTGGTAGAGNGPGDYVIYVKDANGCVKSAPVYVPMNAAPTLTLPAFASNQCTLPSTGYTFTATATGTGTLTYDTVPSTGSNTTGIFNIPAVSTSTVITLKVSDTDGCFDTKTIIIYPPISVSPQATTQPTCNLNDGQITVNAIGGTGTYVYSITPNPATITLAGNVFSGVPFGSYTVTATNTLTGCSDSAPITLNQPVPVAFTMTTVPVSCNGGANDGQINVILSVGSINTPYTYQIDAVGPPYQSTGLFTGVAAGAHTITVRSNLPGCFLTLPVTVGQPALPLSVTGSATVFGCAANNTVNTSTITLTAAGGTVGTGYLYSITGTTTGYSLTNTFPITDTGAVQIITGYVKDSKGCIATTTVTINPLPTITAVNIVQTTAINCNNNTEIVTVNVTGGSGNFEYSLQPVTPTSYQASNVFTFTTTGSYDIIVKDLTTGCTKTATTYIVAPFNTIDVVATAGSPLTCNGALSSMSFNVSGYTGAYSYEVFAGANPVAITTGNGNTLTNPTVLSAIYPAGTYTIKVTETAAPFCVKTSNVITILGPPAPLALSIVTNVNANCNANAQVTVNATGGTPNYTYAFVTSILPVPTVFVASPLGSLDTAISLNWFVYVKDANGCIIANPLPVTIIKDPLPTVAAPTITSNVCDFTATTYTFTANGTGLSTVLAPLLYSINGSAATPTWQTSATFTLAIPSVLTPITVSIKDKNGCIATATAANTIQVYPAIGLSITPTSQPTCNTGGPDGEISVSAIGGSGSYTLSISPSGTLNASLNGFEDLAGGVIYTVKVKDNVTLCERTATVTLATPMPVTLGTSTKNDVTCNGGSDGSLTVLLAATTPTVNNNQPYLYSIIAPSPIIRPNQLSPTFQNLVAGTYSVQITSGLNCTNTQPITITITQPNLINVATPIVVQAGCTTANTTNYATITCGLVTGGNGSVYSYQFFDGAGISVQGPGPSNVYIVTSLSGGTNYTIKVTDIKGCSGTSPAVNVTPFVELVSVNVAVTQKITCLAGESILVTTATLPSVANPPLSYTVTGISPVVFNQTNTTGVFTGLGIGFYNVSVINTLTGCRVIGAVHNVYNPNTFILSIPVADIVNVACYGGNTGSAKITIIDNVTPPDDAGAFSYIIKDSSNVTIQSGNSPNAGPLTISGLSAGTYTAIATLTSLTGPRCSAQLVFTITQPNAAVSVTATAVANVTCTNNQGVINVIPSGGTLPYTITLLNTTTGVNGTATTGLAAGVYNITVTDANGTAGGCFATTSVTLVRPITISGTAVQVAPILCNGNATATIAVNNAAGGHVGPPSYYLYTLLNTLNIPIAGPQSSNVFTAGYVAGTYSVKITDDYSCDFTTLPIIISEPLPLTTILSNPIAITCAANAGLLLTASGGTAPYSYSTTLNGTYTAFNSVASTTISVGPGTYKYFVKDANGCKTLVSNDIVIQAIPAITMTSTQINVTCFGNSTGEILAVAQGGSNTNYTYTIASIPAAFTANNTTGLFVNLPAGTYSITATTSGGCTKTLTPIVISQPLEFKVDFSSTNVSCKGEGDGQLSIVTTNSVGVVQYLLTPGNPNSVFQDLRYTGTPLTPLPILGLSPGPYTIRVQDASGCDSTYNFNITEPTSLNNDPTTNLLQEYCVGDNTGGFTVNMTSNSGTPPYKVSLDNNSATAVYIPTNNGIDSHIFSGISGGDHIVYVKDKNGCLIQIPVKLDPAINIQATLKVDYICKDAVANPSNDINKLTVTVDPVLVGTITYQLDGAGLFQTSPIFMNLSPGPHFVNIKNEVLYTTPDRSSICTKSFNTPIVKFIDPLLMNLINGNLNEIIAVTSGGTAPYNYDFNGINTGANNTYIFTKTDNYFVTVTDNSGCPLTVSRQFNFIDIFIPNFFTPDGDGNNDGWGPTNTYNYKNLVFFIFDRYGRKVGTFNEGQFWDGRYDGIELPSGDYWYMIKADGENSEREFVGNFTLYR